MYMQMQDSSMMDERKPVGKRRWEDTLRRESARDEFKPLRARHGRDEDYDDYDPDYGDLDDEDYEDDDDFEDDDEDFEDDDDYEFEDDDDA